MSGDLGALLDLSWKLLLVLGLAVLATRALRWMSSPSMAPSSVLKLVARLPVGPQQSITLLAVGSKRIVVGVTAQQITLLAELTSDDLPADPAGVTMGAPGSAWAEVWRAVTSGKTTGSWGKPDREG